MLWSLALLALVASTQGRVVNISNTWVLPEEGFPVFYRYFRDRISWYEADAVCQFHHANLVTVDTTAQYDAVRAYLKELDITSAVWVGLIRSNPDGDFTWTDYRGLSSDGYWSSAPDTRSAPLCAAADPAADYRWEARACGGPMVASFICELPVPQWASGSEGCMVRELPALTILYLPESAAVQLTADCGLAGVKRVQCTGNVKREELLKHLSCGDDSENITTEIPSDIITTEMSSEQDLTQEVNTDEDITTEREGVTLEQHLVRITPIPYQQRPIIKEDSTFNQIALNKDINIKVIQDNNLESNDIPKYGDKNNFLSEEESNKLEDEKNMAQKQLHNDLASLGNYETIFSQSSDHFIPPLVMAKAKMSDDMTVLSVEEKHAQQLAEQHKHKGYGELNPKPITHETLQQILTVKATTEKPFTVSVSPTKSKDIKINKYGSLKKYNEKSSDLKSKLIKLEKPLKNIEKLINPSQVELITPVINTTTTKLFKSNNTFETDGDHSIDLTVTLKKPSFDDLKLNISQVPSNINASFPKIYMFEDNKTKKDFGDAIPKVSNETQMKSLHEIIKIKIPGQLNSTPTEFEVTTKILVTDNSMSEKDDHLEFTTTHMNQITEETITNKPLITDLVDPNEMNKSYITTRVDTVTPILNNTGTATVSHITITPKNEIGMSSTVKTITTLQENNTLSPITLLSETIKDNNKTKVASVTDPTSTIAQKLSTGTTYLFNVTESLDIEHEEFHDMEDIHDDDLHSSETEDDFQSPLLSAANEPLHRPNRSRRPQQIPNRIKKFNPFRILG